MSGERFQLGEYWIERRKGTKNWQRTWRENGEKQRSTLGTSDFEQAKRRLAEWFVANAEIKDERPSDAPLGAILDRYMAQHGSKIASHETQRAAVQRWRAWWGDEATIADLTIPKQEAFIVHLHQEGLSDGYIKRVISVGKAAVQRAVRHHELIQAPHIALPPDGEAFEHTVTTEHVVAFLNAIPPELNHLWLYCMIRLNTGCRGDAALDLQPFQIDRAAKLIRLNPSGRRQTKKRRPVIPLTQTLQAVLPLTDKSEWIVNWHGNKVLSVKRAWRNTRAQAGLPDWFAPKALRHAVATELRRRGVPGWEVSGQLGHKNGDSHKTTEVYAKFDPAYLGKARKAIDAWMKEIARFVPRLAGSVRGQSNKATNVSY